MKEFENKQKSPPVPFPAPGILHSIFHQIAVLACCSLNYFRPHKNPILFCLSQLSFLATTFKYVAALMLKLDAGQADDGSMDIIGWMLIGVDIFVFVSFFICLMLAVWHVRLQIKKISKVKRRIRALGCGGWVTVGP